MGLFRPPRWKYIAEVVTFETPGKAREAAGRLVRALERGRLGRLRIGRRRALSIARALQYAANRAKAAARNPRISARERAELRRISEIYDRAAERAFEIYREKYK